MTFKTGTSFFLMFIALCSDGYGQNIRVATFNVNYANTQGDQVLDAIAAANPEVLCLQETTLQSERFLKKRLGDFKEFTAVGHNGHYFAERFVFASKQKPSSVEYFPPQAGLFGFYEANFILHNRTVRILNIHLAPFGVARDASLRQAMKALGETEETHEKEIASILERVDPETPTIICGDFNSLASFKAPQALIDHGFTDSMASVNNDPDQQITWSWPSRPIPLRFRIDYIFHSRHFRTVTSEVIERKGSDHFLLVSELQFVPEEK